MSTGESSKVIVFALAANLGIALSKFVGAFLSGSAALLAEAIHSLVDCTNQVLLLIGAKAATKQPTDKHPLGFGRETFFWSFLVAILLFSLGGLFAIYEGIHKLEAGENSLGSPLIGIAILSVGIVLESLSFRTCIQEVRKQNPYGSLWVWFHKTTSAELLVVFTEDAAALVGLVIAIAAILMAWLTGNPAWDAYGSIAVGTLLVAVAILLATEIKSLIVGESPSENLRPGIEEIVTQVIASGRVLRLIALQTGASEILVSYKIHPGDTQQVTDLIDKINEIETRVRAKFPQIRWQFVEPDWEP